MDADTRSLDESQNGGPPTKVNFNTAEMEDLTAIPGIGPEMAKRIVAARPFENLSDLVRVSGIGPSVLENMKPYLTLDVGDNQNEAAAGKTEAPLVLEEGETEVFDEPEVLMDVEETDLPADEVALFEDEEMAEALPDETAIVEAEFEEFQPEEAETADEVEVEEIGEGETIEIETLPAPEIEAIEEEETPEPEPMFTPEPSPMPVPGFITRGQAFWMAVGVGFLAFLLALVVSLGILATVNDGQLQFATPGETLLLNRRVDTLLDQADNLQGDIGSLQTRMDNLDGLAGRVDVVEEMSGQLGSDLANTNSEVTQLATQAEELASEVGVVTEQVGVVTEQVDTLQSQGDRVQTFMTGLQDLLNQVFPSEPAESETP
jgi:competence ComEA-like helix-hairpin-helix protein